MTQPMLVAVAPGNRLGTLSALMLCLNFPERFPRALSASHDISQYSARHAATITLAVDRQ